MAQGTQQGTTTEDFPYEIYSSLVNDLPGLFCRFNLDGIIEVVNNANAATYNLKPEDLVGQTFYAYIPEEEQEEVLASINALTPEAPVITLEHRVALPDGSIRWHRWINRLITDENGRAIAYQAFGLDITEEKEVILQLQEKEKLLRTVAENFPRSYLSVINPDLTIGFTSGQEFTRLQLDPDLFIGLHVRDVFAPYGQEVTDKIIDAYMKAFAGEQQTFELDLTEMIQSVETVPLFDDQGNIEKILAVVKNITERKQTEQALRNSEARYRGIVEDLVELLQRFDADGTVTFANDAYEAIFGTPGDSLVGKNIKDHLDEDVLQILWEKINRLTPENPVEIDEHSETLKDGRKVWYRWIDRGIFDEDGNLVEVQGMGHDITSRHEAEARIRNSETQLHHIIETVPEGVILLDGNTTVLRTNPVAKNFLEQLSPGWQEGPITQLGDRALQEILTTPPKGTWHEIKSGDYTFESIIRPVENSAKNAGWVIVLRDVTDERVNQQRINQQERLAAVGHLAAGIAHDFNNVLAVIILYVENIIRTVQLPAIVHERLNTINLQAQRAADLVQQILDFSRQSVLERQLLNLLSFMREQIGLLNRTLPEHIKIELQFESNDYLIRADPSRIQQMIMNLAVNARDAMPKGGRIHFTLSHFYNGNPLEMPIRDMPPGNWVKLQVSDSGSGIDPEVKAHIFEPFYTTKEIGQGTGLGLAQVYGIIEQHEGYIDVETEPGQGTTFILYFPSMAAQENLADLPNKDELQKGQGQLILLVEDHDTTRQALFDSLEMLEYKVVEAANGREAMAILEKLKTEIDLVVSDIVMPEMGGVSLLHAMREQNITTPLIFLTGHPLDHEIEDLPNLGLTGWHLKPPNRTALSNLVAQALKQ
jgi:PAS domain S-box-containing protein